jgi:hypothetical protein
LSKLPHSVSEETSFFVSEKHQRSLCHSNQAPPLRTKSSP